MFSAYFSARVQFPRLISPLRVPAVRKHTACALLALWLCNQGRSQPPSTLDSLHEDLRSEKNGIRMTLENVGHSVFMLNLGAIIGKASFPHLRLTLDGTCKEKGALSNATQGGVISGRGDPWVIVLPPQAGYSLFIPLAKLVPRGRSQSLVSIPPGCVLRAEFAGSVAVDSAPGGKSIKFSITRNGPTDIPFWVGKVSAAVSP
jgi:hypothetical protein